ncbi:XrtA/PEP-CTERM system TPR-repeat protein PrsT [Vibrio alfacsensis]|uniref:XrtA/PEP-CTERM system TPR-repeat protein PrsT n=1 Tax=Vibrio alfacsensis TaxID=1074311 RepID=UPI0040693DE7
MLYKKDFIASRFALLGLTATMLLFPDHVHGKDYIQSAEQYLNKNEVSAAMIQLKNAIQQQPESALPRYMLGKVYLQQGDFSKAEKELSRALKFGYSTKDVLPLLARSLYSQNKIEDMLVLFEEFEQEDATPDLLAFAALAEIKMDNLDAAKTLIAQNTSNTLYSQLANATYLSVTNQTDKAYAKVLSMLDSAKSNSDVWQLKGHLEMSKQDFSNAYESYTQAYKHSPAARHYPYLIANALIHAERYEDAEPIVDKLLAINSQHSELNVQKALIQYSKKNYADAKNHADIVLRGGTNSPRAMAISGVSAFQMNQYEQAYQLLGQTLALYPNNSAIKRMYSITQLKLGYLDEAIDGLNNFDAESPQDSLFLSQASVALSKVGRSETALQLAQRASIHSSSQTETTLGLAKLANNDESGLEDLYAALENDPAMAQAKYALANYYLSRNMLDKAESLANKWLTDNPDDTDGLMIKGIISKEKGKNDTAKDYFKKVNTLKPEHTLSILALAEVESAQGNSEAAYSLALKAKKLSPYNHTATKQLLRYSKQLDRLDDTITVIEEQIKADPFNVELKVQKANALVLNRDSEAAIRVLESIPEVDHTATTSQFLGNLYASSGDLRAAKRQYQLWLESAPYSQSAYIRNIQVLDGENRIDEGLKLLKKAQKLFPNDVRFSLMKAHLLIKKGHLETAQIELDKLSAQVHDTGYTLGLQGRIYLAKQDLKSAIDTYKKRYTVMPGVPTARELASVYSLNQQDEQAIEFLSEVIEQYGDVAAPLKLQLAELQLKSHPEKAIEQYQNIITTEPNNAVALNNLAWLYLNSEQAVKACEFAQRAYNLANTNVDIADTYGYCLLKSGDINQALELLELAHKGKADSAEIALHFVEALLSANRVQQATKILAQVVTDEPHLVAVKSKLEQQANKLAQ